MTRWKLAVAMVLACAANAQSAAQGNSAPTAILDAPGVIDFGAPLQLSGARSTDADGRITRYVWTRIEGSGGGMPLNMPVGTLESNYVVPQPAGQPLAIGRHRFQLFVNDDSGNRSATVEVAVIVADRTAPSAVLDAPRQATQIVPFQLSGSRSTDAGGRIVRYQWVRLSGSANGPMPLGQPMVTDNPALVVNQSPTSYFGTGRQVFRLVVVDDSGNHSLATDVAVDVLAPLPGGLTR